VGRAPRVYYYAVSIDFMYRSLTFISSKSFSIIQCMTIEEPKAHKGHTTTRPFPTGKAIGSLVQGLTTIIQTSMDDYEHSPESEATSLHRQLTKLQGHPRKFAPTRRIDYIANRTPNPANTA